MFDFLTIAAANLRVRRLRTAFTVFGVAVAVASFIALYTLARGPERNWQRGLEEMGGHLIGYERGVVHMISSRVPLSLMQRIEQVPGVANVTPQIGRFVPADDEGRQMVLVGAPVPSGFWRDVPLREGRLPRSDEVWVVVIGADAAQALGKRVGDVVELMWRRFEIIGVAAYANPMNASSLLAPLAALQELERSGDTATFFLVHLGTPGDERAVDQIVARLNAVAAGLVFVRTEDIARSSKVLKLLQAISWIVSAIAIGMGVLVVANTLVMAIAERTREIGVLSALGWSAARISALILLESAVLTAVGSVIGIALGIGLALWLGSHPVLRGLLEPVFSLELFALLAAAMAAMVLLGGAYPAWVAARVQPARALQHE
jgi:putative ABC transport system permease protein